MISSRTFPSGKFPLPSSPPFKQTKPFSQSPLHPSIHPSIKSMLRPARREKEESPHHSSSNNSHPFMEILNPSPPPSPSIYRFSSHPRVGISTAAAASSSSGGSSKIHVAVGKSPEKTLSLLRWTFRRFGCSQIVLLHVYQPSPVIPTLLGKIPVSQATEESVRDFRRTEKAQVRKILRGYLDYCHKSQVQASIVAIECDQIQNGIVDLVNQNSITMLIVGSAPDNGFRLPGNSSKATYLAKNVPSFCEVWFVSKGRHVWTRETVINNNNAAAAAADNDNDNDASVTTTRMRFSLSSTSTEESENGSEIDLEQADLYQAEQRTYLEANGVMGYNRGAVYGSKASYLNDMFSHGGSSPSLPDPTADVKVQTKLTPQENQSTDLNEVIQEAERSRRAAFSELLRRKEIEKETDSTLKRVRVSEAAEAQEVLSRERLEEILKKTKEQHEILSNQREEALKELDKLMYNLTLLDSHAHALSDKHIESAAELEVIHSSIDILQAKELRRTGMHVTNYNMISMRDDEPCKVREFSLADINAATCDFSESFKLFQGGNGVIYKGEIMNRSVAIKRFHPHNVRGVVEFQQEVDVLSKLRHPHLVSLLGACPEALCVVCEYFPNGTLQDCLFSRGSSSSNPSPLSWRSRVRIVSEIASTLFFLHSRRPQKIVHGDLNPENILLDSDFRCKIGDFGISRIVSDENVDIPLYQRNANPKGSLPYMDPDLQRNKFHSTKSDIYSFGIIVLQLLTGKPPLGLANEIRRAVASEDIISVLDKTAGEWPFKVAKKLAEFGLKCCDLNARTRPELTPEIVRELEQLHIMKERPVPSYFLCPILQEIMHDPQVAADGFTYEGRALRDWLENGRETSPMTNLKLKHLNLTPNHALRFAIQDWLCQS